jgi:hypothetical protein
MRSGKLLGWTGYWERRPRVSSWASLSGTGRSHSSSTEQILSSASSSIVEGLAFQWQIKQLTRLPFATPKARLLGSRGLTLFPF